MLARLDHKVRDLTRVKMGPLELTGLKPGDVRTLTLREIKTLRAMGKRVSTPHDSKAEAVDDALDADEPRSPAPSAGPRGKARIPAHKPRPQPASTRADEQSLPNGAPVHHRNANNQRPKSKAQGKRRFKHAH
jgi:hypothetical protein